MEVFFDRNHRANTMLHLYSMRPEHEDVPELYAIDYRESVLELRGDNRYIGSARCKEIKSFAEYITESMVPIATLRAEWSNREFFNAIREVTK